MRFVLLVAVLLIAVSSPERAAAIEYPWCAIYGDSHGGTNCGFTTLEQCRAAISGNGGLCERNPSYTAPQPAPRRPRH